ncbi:MAG: amidohydrolase family protein [Fimbriimonadales bacterium]
MILRPDAVVLAGGKIQRGVEVCIQEGRIDAIRPWTTAARDEAGQLLSPAFVNAHSHLEYFDLIGKLGSMPYWPWIREITRIKPTRSTNQVAEAATTAANMNVATGVAAIGEYSDWPVSGEAMANAGLRGRIFQEVITLGEPEQKFAQAKRHAAKNASHGVPTHLSAHSTYTVSGRAIAQLANTGEPNAIHAGETAYEDDFYERGEGPIADLYSLFGIEIAPPGCSAIAYLDSFGALHAQTQLIHACAISDEDIEIAARGEVTIAHCPRSNLALGCPNAPIARLRNKGVKVGLGMDSAASSGSIDFFDEMRAAIEVSRLRSEPLSPEDVWTMATSEGADSIWLRRDWRIAEGANPDLILLRPHGGTLGDIITNGSPPDVVRLIRL